MNSIKALLLVGPLLLGGCGGMFASHSEDGTVAVRRQAAFDLSCPEAQVEVVPLNFRTYGASGCGGHASYMAACGLVGCTALVNGSPAMNALAEEERQQREREERSHRAQ